jgi:hypothetical protein
VCHAGGGGNRRPLPSFDGAGVQCESCHGRQRVHGAGDAGSGGAGRRAQVDAACTRCHTPGIGRPFDVEGSWPRIDHTAWKDVPRVEYKTPFNLAVTQDDRSLLVACEAANSLIILDIESGKVLAEIPVGAQPHFVLLSQDDALAYVSNRGSDDVSVVDVPSLRSSPPSPSATSPTDGHQPRRHAAVRRECRHL